MREKGIEGISRRKFISNSAMGLGMAGLPFWFAQESLAAELAKTFGKGRVIGANDTIQIAGIGVGGKLGGYQQGLGDTRILAGKDGVKCIAICDVEQVHLDDGALWFGEDCKTKTKDYREILSKPEIDAVVIGTPDHWHAQIAIEAMNAGKHVYCEKPLTLTIDEGKQIVKTMQKTGRIFQTGSQQRSDGRFRLACELVRNGRLGKISTVEAHIPGGGKGGPYKKEDVPAGLDYDRWLGPRPAVDYFPDHVHGNFRFYLDYSGGEMTDWGAHHNDIAQWGLGYDRSGPVTIEATSSELPMGDYEPYRKAWIESRIKGKGPMPENMRNHRDVFPKFNVTYTYDNGVKLITSDEGENGVLFTGELGWIFVSRSEIKASDPKLISEPLPADRKVNLYVSNDHHKNFIDCIRTNKPCICDAEIGHRSASVCHLGNTALLLGRKLTWDPKKEVYVNDREANQFLKRPRCKPWTL